MKKRNVNLILVVSLVLIISLSFVSANIFEDFWNWLTGKDEVSLSPTCVDGVDNYCAQVAGCDIWTGTLTLPGYGINTIEVSDCFPKLNNGSITKAPAKGEECYDYVCALYRGIADGVLTSSTTDKKCTQENGFPSDYLTHCQIWCPESLNQVWSSSENKCIVDTGEEDDVGGIMSSVCGNNILETGEECDTQMLNSQTCISRGYDGGILRCGVNCQFDTSACVNDIICGDGKAEGSEVCDGSDLRGKTCVSLNVGFTRGSLNCKTDCTFNTMNCVSTTPYVPICGNSIVDSSSGEQCDDGNTISSDACKIDCKLNICGDGIINNEKEQCDDKNTIWNPTDGCNAICQINGGWSCVYDNNLGKSVCEKTTQCAQNEFYNPSVSRCVKLSECVDGDKDNFYKSSSLCSETNLKSISKFDCNDGNGGINPTQAEICNDIDDDCDGVVDEGLVSCQETEISISIATKKDVYKVGEVIELT